MISNYNIIAIGPLSGSITGQRLSFEMVCEAVPINFKIDSIPPNFLNLFTFLKYLFLYIKVLISCISKNNIIYITISRSPLGILRDLLLILPFFIFSNKKIAHIHGNENYFFNREKDDFFKLCIKKFLNLFDSIIVLSSQQRNIVSKISNKNINSIYVIENAITRFDDFDNYHRDEIFIVYNSNIIYSKGILQVLAAANKLKFNKLKFIIFGEPIADEYVSKKCMANLIEGYKNLDNVIFTGKITGELKNYYLKKSCVTILPTFYNSEASPLCLIEALSYGHFIISTSQGFISDLLSDCEWQCLNEVTENSVYLGILDYLKSNRPRFIDKNFHVYKNNYTIDVFNYKILNFFDNL